MKRKTLFRYKYWTIACRKRGTQPLYRQEQVTDLTVILRARSGIQADPFLIGKDGKSYLFYETAGPVTGKGKIACLALDDAHAKPRIVLKEPFHLSYPYVFFCAGQYYMMPESRQNHKVMLYRAKQFPWEWEPCRELLGEDAVDSTLFECGGSRYLFTYRDGALEIYECETDAQGLPEKALLLERLSKSKRARPAGALIREGDRYYRPAQLCENFYGEAVLINEIDTEMLQKSVSRKGQSGLEGYREQERFRIQASGIRISGLHVLGIHTYNADERYEVVDLYCAQYSPWVLVKKCCYIPLQCMYELWRKRSRRS
ncbi:MAG: hypothetical protein HDQ98_04700 [Lachnospiraceae bacterium]|nr:hypothetical protein [Lachnospiraceae bacterium]